MASEETPKSAPQVTPKTGDAEFVETKSQATQATAPAPKSAPVTKAKTARGAPAAKAPAKPKTRKPSPPRIISGETAMAAAKKDAAKETFETVTAASNEAMKEGFEKSLNAMNEFSAFQKDTVDAVIASATATSKSFEEMNASAMAFAKKSMEDGVAAAKTMAGAKSVQELIEIHADYTKSTLDAYLSEVNKTTDLMSTLMKDGFKPLNDRMAAAVEAMQSAR
ncbi:MAG: phasin family protein [Oceanicaulis sp.]